MDRISPLHFSDNKLFKCGEILFSSRVNVNIYAFICTSCDELFETVADFCNHFDIQHADDLLFRIAESEELQMEDEIIEQIEYDDELEENTSGKVQESVTEINDKTLDADQMAEYEEIHLYEDDSVVNSEVYDTTSLSDEDVKLEDDDNGMVIADDSSDIFNYKDSTSDVDEEKEDNAENEKVLKLAVILEYEKYPVLWNTNLTTRKGRHLRDDAFATITKNINKQLQLQMHVDEIRNAIKLISINYRNEVHKQKLAELNGEKRNPPWYFNKLKFLDIKTTTSKKKNKDEYLARKQIGLPLPYFNDKQHSALFDIFKQFPSLWNVQDVGFHSKKIRDTALEDMVKIVNDKMDLDFTADKLRRKLYQIRYACSKEKFEKVECERKEIPFKSTCKYWTEIEFLEPHVQPFQCPYCEEIFGYPHQFVLHRAEHEGSLPYKCTICDHGFKLAANCVVHMRRHNQELPYPCNECGKRFVSSTEVTLHMRHHNDDRQYVCEVCGQSFFTPTSLDYHKRRHDNIRPYKCSICSKAFYDNYQMKQHMKCHLNVRDMVCNVCGKAFKLAKHLRQHKHIHDENKKYSCKVCGKKFSQNAGLSGHMKTHNTMK